MTYPTIRPELTLDFANSRQLDPRITFSRSSSATYLNPDTGLITSAYTDQARFEKEGLLIEESRTNTLTHSTEFDNAAWTVNGSSITADVQTSPDGTNTADKLVESAGAAYHIIYETTPGSAANPSFSCFAKAAERNFINLRFGIPGLSDRVYATFDLTDGSVTDQGTIGTFFTNIQVRSESVGNSWYRFSISASSTSSIVLTGVDLSDVAVPTRTNGAPTYTGDGTSGVYIWGAQLEVGSFPTSYIPTAGSTVTRAVDVAQITGDNFSSWYNGSQGSFVAMCDYKKNSVYNMIVEGVGGGTFRDFSVGVGAGNPNFVTRYSYTALDITPAGGPILNNTPFKLAGAYSSSGSAAVFNGGAVGTTGAITSVSTPADSMTIGHRIGGGLNLNGNISRLSYYTRRLTDSELQTITS